MSFCFLLYIQTDVSNLPDMNKLIAHTPLHLSLACTPFIMYMCVLWKFQTFIVLCCAQRQKIIIMYSVCYLCVLLLIKVHPETQNTNSCFSGINATPHINALCFSCSLSVFLLALRFVITELSSIHNLIVSDECECYNVSISPKYTTENYCFGKTC